MNPGEMFCEPGDIEINAGRDDAHGRRSPTPATAHPGGLSLSFLRDEPGAAIRARIHERFSPEHRRRHRGALRARAGTRSRAGRLRRRSRGVRLPRRRSWASCHDAQSDTPRAYAEMYGPTTGDRVRLGDTELVHRGRARPHDLRRRSEVRRRQGDPRRHGAEPASARADVADTVITNALIVDHWGIVKADIGIKDGRIAGIGKAGNPDVQPGVDIVIGAGHGDHRRRGLDRHRRRHRRAHPLHLPAAGARKR